MNVRYFAKNPAVLEWVFTFFSPNVDSFTLCADWDAVLFSLRLDFSHSLISHPHSTVEITICFCFHYLPCLHIWLRSSVSLRCSSQWYLETGSINDLGAYQLARMACCQAPGTLLPPCVQFWDYTHDHCTRLFMWGLRSELRSSCLPCKPFSD